jgi:fructokinase
MLLRADEIPVEAVRAANIFHYGSITLIDEPVRSATLLGARAAGEAGRLVSFDPNLRPQLWPSLEQARQAILEGMRWAGMVKVSDEELAFITGLECGGGGGADAEGREGEAVGADAAVQALFAQFPNLRMVALTSGPEGSTLYTRDQAIRVPGFRVEAVDTTGAGDGFLAGLLFQMNRQMKGGEAGRLFDWNQSDRFWAEAARFGNAVGAMVVTKRGGIPSMPEMAAVERFMAECEI